MWYEGGKYCCRTQQQLAVLQGQRQVTCDVVEERKKEGVSQFCQSLFFWVEFPYSLLQCLLSNHMQLSCLHWYLASVCIYFSPILPYFWKVVKFTVHDITATDEGEKNKCFFLLGIAELHSKKNLSIWVLATVHLWLFWKMHVKFIYTTVVQLNFNKFNYCMTCAKVLHISIILEANKNENEHINRTINNINLS